MIYVFTFGYGHYCPLSGSPLANHYTLIEGETYEEARAKMVQHYGQKWAFQYDSPEQAGVERWGLIFHPTPGLDLPPPCSKCGKAYKLLGTGTRLVPTGFIIYDSVNNRDVHDMDACAQCEDKTHGPS